MDFNGKEYARLEDVPEEFRALLKDSDGDGIPDVGPADGALP